MFRIKYDYLPKPVKLILPWLTFLLLLGTILELDEMFGKFGYDPGKGQCTIITPRVIPVLELLGTYLPFIVMILCYSKGKVHLILVCSVSSSISLMDFMRSSDLLNELVTVHN